MPRRPGAPRKNANALTHGLTSTASLHLQPGENPDELALLWQASAALAPTPLASYLAGRVAGVLWRLQRIPALEARALGDVGATTPPPPPGADDDSALDAALDELLADTASGLKLDLLMRYEAHLQRCLLSTLAALHAIRQLGDTTECPAPSALDRLPSPAV